MGLDESDWFKSYLGGKKQVVVANDTSLEPGIVNRGVLHDSIIGPLLFLYHINDMPINLKSKLLIYADALYSELNACRQ